jgi:hypothetical protein
LDGILKAYSWEFKDKTRRRDGGRITQQEFWDLEAGVYGKVDIIDYVEYCRRYEYPFIEILFTSAALTDPVLKARLGSRAEEYILAHTAYARAWHRVQAGIKEPVKAYSFKDTLKVIFSEDVFSDREFEHVLNGADDSDPFIIKVGDASNCSYYGSNFWRRPPDEGYAFAHLVSTGRLCNVHHDGEESLVLDVGLHEWWNGARLVGIKSGADCKTGLDSGPDVYELTQKYWQELLIPIFPPDIKPVGFRHLIKIGEQWFTRCLKKGASMDSTEPEYVVTSMEKIGWPQNFLTEIGGHYALFKYDLKEVQAIAPPGANAYYFAGEPKLARGDKCHSAVVQFCRIKADATKRVMSVAELSHNYQKQMQLLALEEGNVM